MIEVSGISLSLDAGLEFMNESNRGGLAKEDLKRSKAFKEVARELGIAVSEIASLRLIKRSVDARKKSNVHFIVTLEIGASKTIEERLLKESPRGISVKAPKVYVPLEIPSCEQPAIAPVVVGAGPAGLFAALYLARAGLCPVLIERGAPVEQRQQDVEQFIKTGVLDPDSNIQFGEGGAGTFSDGKLTTNTKNPLTAHVLRWFVEAGAPGDILWQAHPHLGSDKLPGIVSTMRNEIIARGGKVLFHTRLVDLRFENNVLSEIVVETQQGDEENKQVVMPAQKLILACGHSARDVFELCRDKEFTMEQKPFSVGVRIEHPQAMINESQWGKAAHHKALGSAEYKMAVHLPSGRSVYTFCMCPGGEVVAATSETGGIVTNGMSNYARNGKNANAAVLVSVEPRDFPTSDVLAGIELQRSIERAAFECSKQAGGEPYQAPCQVVGEFLSSMHSFKHDKTSQPSRDEQKKSLWCAPTYARGVVDAPIKECFPSFVSESLAEALPLFARKLKGFDDSRALLTAPETRSSSSVRICRGRSFEAYFVHQPAECEVGSIHDGAELLADATPSSGVFPCGEGPGFAGGIMSAAVDGLRVAQEVARQYCD